jgi:hypothetical protein
VAQKKQCELLEKLKREAVESILGAKKLRWSKDVSLYEDSEIARDQRIKIDAFISNLLAGHDGQPCPCGDRPIIGGRPDAAIRLRGREFPGPEHSPQKKLA